MQYGKIKVGGVYHIKDIYGEIVRVKVTSKKISDIYRMVYFEYLDGKTYFGAVLGVTYSETQDIPKLLD